MPTSFVMIFERAGPEKVLYVSGNCQKVLGYTPDEMVGTCILDYSYDPHAKHYSCQWPADNPELGVTMLPHNMRRKDNTAVYVHAISINCTGHLFTIVVAYPELGDIRVQESILYKLQYEVDYNYNTRESIRTLGDSRSTTADPVDTGDSDIIYPKHPKVTKESLQKAHVYTARACRAKACFVLKIDEQGGPLVEFVTNSISNVFSGYLDGHDIIDRPFLAIVDPKDTVRAARFFQSLRDSHTPQLCSLGLLVDPRGSEVVQVELFGASSDDKFVLLCQKKRNGAAADEPPYMSLEEIVSSDYESSDVNDAWRRLLW